MTHTSSLEADGFHLTGFNAARPFSSFLPGIAGEYGKPMWVFYANRGQCISSFGVRDRNSAMLEFQPANKAYVLTPLLRGLTPVVWFVNLFVQGLLKLLRIKPASDAGTTLTQEELRSLVLEGQYFRGKHRSMLANLLDLESFTVDDVMTPRNQIHAIDLDAKPALLAQQIAAAYHTRLPAYEGELDDIVGVLPLKQVVHLQQEGAVDAEHLRAILRTPYFVPAGTPLLTQLQQFQTDRRRLGLVVDEYGELQGLVTIEDIIEEIIGDFTSAAPDGTSSFTLEADGSVVAVRRHRPTDCGRRHPYRARVQFRRLVGISA